MKYPGTGNLGQALEDLKMLVARGEHKQWPEFWQEFAEQAFADIIALEVELKMTKEELVDLKWRLSQ